jgi:hypothetical protein
VGFEWLIEVELSGKEVKPGSFIAAQELDLPPAGGSRLLRSPSAAGMRSLRAQ